MEYSAEQLNYFRICYVAFNLVPDGLRKIFKQEWDFLYETRLGEWKDTPKNGAVFYKNESRKSHSKNARYLATIQNGNTAEWDCSCLFFAILFSDSIGATLGAAIRKDVDDLRQVRNDVAHTSEAKLTDAEFKNYVGRVLLAFNSLKLQDNDINAVKNQTSFPTAEVNKLKVQASNLLAELKKTKSDFQVAQSKIKKKEEQVEALTSDLQVAQDTIQSKEEQVKCLTQEINVRVSSFCNLTCKSSHETIKRINDVTRNLDQMKELEHSSNEAVSTIYLPGNPGCGKVHGDEHGTVADCYEKLTRIDRDIRQFKEKEISGCRLAISYSEIGQQTEEIEMDERALYIFERLYGSEDNDNVATLYYFLGLAYSKMNQNRQAIEFFEKAIAIFERINPEHEIVANSCHKLARHYRDIGEHSKALERLEKELKIRVKVHGKEHGTVADCYKNLASVYVDTHEHCRAKRFFKRELKIRVKIHGEEHDAVAECCKNMARVYWDTRKHFHAIDLFEHELKIRKKVHGEKHGTVTDCYNNLARVNVAIREHSRAIELYEKELKIKVEVHGDKHDTVADCYSSLARVYGGIREHSQAIKLYEKELKIRVKVHGKEHDTVADCHKNLAIVYWDIREHSQAIEHFEKELKVRVKTHGEEHGTVAVCYNNLAGVYNDNGEHSRAKELIKKEMLVQEKLRGEKHEKNDDVAEICCSLATCCIKTVQQTKAIELHERSLDILKKLMVRPNIMQRRVASYSNMNQNRQAIEFC